MTRELTILFGGLAIAMPHKLGLWAAFGLGVFLHTLMRADSAVRGGKFTTRRQYFSFYAVPLLVRSVLVGIIFWTWTSQPDLLTKGLALVGLGSFSLSLPQIGEVAAVFGYASDSLLEQLILRVPFLRKEIPALDSDTSTTTSTNTADASTGLPSAGPQGGKP